MLTANGAVERHVHGHSHDHHTHEHEGGAHPGDHVHIDPVEAQPPTQPSRAVMLDVGEHAGALILSSSATRNGLEVEIHPAGEPERRTHVWVLPREGRDGETIYAAVFPSLRQGTYAVLETDGNVGSTVVVLANTVTRANWLDCK